MSDIPTFWFSKSPTAKTWHGPHESRAAASQAALAKYGHDDFYTAAGELWFPDLNLSTIVLDELTAQAEDDCGDVGSHWPNAGVATIDRLDAMLRECVTKWIDEAGIRPTFWKMVDVQHNEPKVKS